METLLQFEANMRAHGLVKRPQLRMHARMKECGAAHLADLTHIWLTERPTGHLSRAESNKVIKHNASVEENINARAVHKGTHTHQHNIQYINIMKESHIRLAQGIVSAVKANAYVYYTLYYCYILLPLFYQADQHWWKNTIWITPLAWWWT